MSAALLLVSSISVPLVSADVVELRNGQRVEGTFEGADEPCRRLLGRSGSWGVPRPSMAAYVKLTATAEGATADRLRMSFMLRSCCLCSAGNVAS